MAAEIDWDAQQKVFPPETVWKFTIDQYTVLSPTTFTSLALEATGATREEAEAKIKHLIPPGRKIIYCVNNYRMPDEEVLSDEYMALIRARKEAGETDEQARILNRETPKP